MPRTYLTAQIPGAGGTVKTSPEDFQVEEVPAYAPSGEGEHLFLWVEKMGHDTPWVARQLAAAAGLTERDVSYAGLKDRQAITRQLFSLPVRVQAPIPEKLEQWSVEGARVLWVKRHGNKLRSGHLRGNRFVIRLRDVRDADAGAAAFAQLQQHGVPNFFGTQRFGARGDNGVSGKALLLGQRLPRAPSRFERKLFLSAYQSELFNRLLEQRVQEGSLGRAFPGDVLRKEETGGLFVCESVEVDQPRVDRKEVSPAGPLFGPKLVEARGEIAAREAAVLTEEAITMGDFARGRGETEGARRPYRVLLGDPELVREGADLLLRFTLPSGSYATEVLAEVTKSDAV